MDDRRRAQPNEGRQDGQQTHRQRHRQSAGVDQPPKEREAGQVNGDARREEDRRRYGRGLVVADDRQFESSGDQDDATEDRHEHNQRR